MEDVVCVQIARRRAGHPEEVFEASVDLGGANGQMRGLMVRQLAADVSEKLASLGDGSAMADPFNPQGSGPAPIVPRQARDEGGEL